jgi:flagellin
MEEYLSMSISLANNLLANSVALNLNKNQQSLQSSVTKLSSGLRINTAADDPSGLAIAEKLQSRVNGFDQAVANVQDATNASALAEGALQTTTDILQRIRSLAVEASSDTNTTSDKTNLQTEVTQLLQEVNSISQNTNFNGVALLDGSHAGFQAATVAFTTTTSNASLQLASSTAAASYGTTGLLIASVFMSALAASVAPGATGGYQCAATAGFTVDGTIELQVINNGTSIGVQATFIASDNTHNANCVSATLFTLANTAVSLFDNVSVTLGNFSTADVGSISFIKVSQTVNAITSPTSSALGFQSGASEGNVIQLGIQATNSATLRISNINLLVTTSSNNAAGAEDAIGQIDNALVTLLTQRANLGAVTVRLQEDSSNDAVAATNIQAAESTIRDLNISAETTKYSADQILISVGTSVLLQSNNNAQSVEKLFQ